MEFPDLGKHCSLESCKRLDFLPFECNACNKHYCLKHRSYEGHSCPEKRKQQLQQQPRVAACPDCSKTISVGPASELTLDEALAAHMVSSDCKVESAHGQKSGGADESSSSTKSKRNRCSLKNCGGKGRREPLLVPFKCSWCMQDYCVRHRLPEGHNCQVQAQSQRQRPGLALISSLRIPSSKIISTRA